MIIGLSGKKQSGKSTLTNHLIIKHGFMEISWAMPLKEIVGKQLFGFNNKQLYGPEADKEKVDTFWGMSPRKVLQIVGTECFRKNICDDFWVKLGVRRIKDMQERDHSQNIVISDCRFPNEVDAIKELGGKVVRVRKFGVSNIDTHPSEIALDMYKDFDYEIGAFHGEIDKIKAMMDVFLKDVLSK